MKSFDDILNIINELGKCNLLGVILFDGCLIDSAKTVRLYNFHL